jgi:ATP-dependent Lon protease
MEVIERLKAKKEELENKYSTLVHSSVPKTILQNKIDALDELIDAYDAKSPSISLTDAQQILNRQAGFEEQKREILENLEIAEYWAPQGVKKDPLILCLVGPAGVGKTTFAQIIAQALGKEFFSLNLGGLSETSVLVGSEASSLANNMGKLAQALVTAKTRDPVILLDEIDKTSFSLNSYLLNILDSTQNQAVLDHYLEVKLDFSQVTFVLAANDLKKIPNSLRESLLSRMKIIELPGYTQEQKKEIAQKIIQKWFTENASLNQNNLEITPEALETLISKTKEKGVRQLEKLALNKIFNYCLLH